MGNIGTMENTEAIQLIYTFKNNDSILWVENDDIQLLVADHFKSMELKNTLVRLKPELVKLLNANKIFSKKDFLNKRIFKTDLKECMLSFSQERLWFFEQYEEGTNAYHIAYVYLLDEQVNKEGIAYALQKVVSRHEVLRSTIEQGEDQAHGIQRIHDTPLSIQTVRLETEDYNALIKEEINRPFDLTKEYPIRAVFYTIASASNSLSDKTLLLVNVHHIASDGWSTDVFENNLFSYYEAYRDNNKTFCLPSLDIQYKDYVLWQKYYLTESVLKTQINYWKEKLTGFQNLELPTDYPRPEKVDYAGGSHEFKITKKVSGKLRELAQKNGVTLNSVMLSTVNILLHKYSGQDDIVLGTVNANRHHRQTEELIGFFVNTQICRTLLDTSQTFEELIQQVHTERTEAQLHRDLPYERLIDELGVERDLSRHPVFQVMFGVQSFGNNSSISSHENYLKPYAIADDLYEVEKFDLSIFIDDSQEEFKGEITYATSLFHKDTITRLTAHYLNLLEMLVQVPHNYYSEIGLLDANEFEQLIFDWNETDVAYSKSKLLHELFEEQATKTPDTVAIVFKGQQLTYGELNEKSNQLAHQLRTQYKKRTKKELSADTFIALFLDRSQEMVIGILGVLKAGGAYVPIDPAYPKDRIDYILEDTQAELILSQHHVYALHPQKLPEGKIMHIDLTENLYNTEDTFNLKSITQPTDLAYVIYTSGTTGIPKGVMVEHAAVLNTVHALYDVYDVKEIKKATAYTSYVFDVSVSELFTTLLQGIELHILENDIRTDSEELAAYFSKNEINLVYLPPVLLSQLPTTIHPALKTVIYAGEPCDKQTAALWSAKVKLFNYYGPTEACIYATGKQIITNEVEQIGLPIQNNKVYILDKKNIPVPIGITGELYIGGAGLARGYLNQPNLTEERFIVNPFATDADKEKGYTRLYKTGDLVKWTKEGTIEYLGRNDDQVKIRGYRIELGEIENALSQVDGIKQSCVLVRKIKTEEATNNYLVGYYVLENKNTFLAEAAILTELSKVLPAYMLPAALISMDTFPLTINGKLDKRALPDPAFDPEAEDNHLPTTPIEKEVCEIWKKLLGLTHVGITNDFFKLGGSSILAIQVSHRMTKVLGCQVKVSDLFKYKTIAQLLTHVQGRAQVTIPKIDSSRTILSFAQERLFFIEQYEGGTHIYNMPALFQLSADTNVEGIKYAVQKVIERHEVLRSTIDQGAFQEHAIQRVHDAPLKIKEVDFTYTDDYESLIKQDINKPFNLSKDYPIRVTLYTIKAPLDAGSKKLLLINTHHIASDGWSKEIFENELYLYYQSYILNSGPLSLPALDIQYKDYAVWQRGYLTGEALEKQVDYWKKKLSGYQNLEFPTDYIRTGEVDYSGAYAKFKINKSISGKLRELAQKNGVTLNSVMLSTVTILLHKYSGQDDIIIGTVNANRQYRQTESLLGFFVNTQANRILLNKSQNFEELIQQVHHEQTEIQSHQDLPFEKLIDALGVERDPSRHPIFQIMFVFQSFGQEKNKVKEQKEYLQPYELKGEDEPAKFDLSFFINDGQEELFAELSYATSLFRKDTITRLMHHYMHLLEQLTEAPAKFYSAFNLLTPQEQKQIIYDWNATDKVYPKDKTIHELFLDQVTKTPQRIAVVYEEQKLSYQELNEKSNQLAHHIRAEYKRRANQLLAPDTLIVLCLDRGLELVIGMLAVLKAGGAYVPIDPNYPQDRIDHILEDTQATLILSQKHLAHNKAKLPQDRVIYIDLTEELYKKKTIFHPALQTTSTNLVYVIYTSGTTGKPKASLIEHHSFVNLINWYTEEFNLTESDSFIICSEICFDLTQKNIFAPLINGGVIYIPRRGFYDPINISSIILSNNVNRINCAPSAFTPILDELYKLQNFYSFDYIFLGGEPISDKILQIIKSKMPAGYFVNTYGPTECGDVTTYCKVAYKDLPDHSIPLGIPVANFKHYILDVNKNPVPVGVIGELYIAGEGLGRGYLNRPELTAERFITNPFATQKDKAKGYTKMYRTGDVVKWLADGNIEYLGRNDDQVKIRGYRIELGEIENAIAQIEGVKQACVLAKERKTEAGSSNYLVGYYVLNNASTLTQTAILDHLSQLLPEYMLPSSLVVMESFPLTINGKLDKRALPIPDFNSLITELVEPTTEIEKEVTDIWKKLLGLEQVGITTDFFRLGGNSILALQASHRMTRLLGCQVKVSDVFKYKTIAQLLAHVKGQSQIIIPKISSNQAILSFAQERLFFIEEYEGGTHIYNIAEVFQLSDNTTTAGIKYAVQKIVERHEVLRSTINKISAQEQIFQIVHDAPLSIEEINLNDTDDYEAIIKQDINKPFNLSKEYPIRVTFYTIKSSLDNLQSKRLLVINIHHIANDGWSSEIFEKELYTYYKSHISNDDLPNIPVLDIQYKDYAVWQRNYLTGETLEKQFSFWKDKLSGYQNLEFPTDYARTSETDYKGATEHFTIRTETSQKLKALAQKNSVALNSVLLSAMTILFNKYTGQNDIVIGGIIANRHHGQTEGLLGFFVNTQANRTILNESQNFEELIRQVQEEQTAIQLHQDLPFEKLVDALGIQRDLSRHPIFQVMFMVQSFGQEKHMTEGQREYLQLYELKNTGDVARFDLSIYIDDSEDAFSGRIVYATSLFHKDTITRFIHHYTHLLDQLIETPNKPYAELSLLTPQETKQIVYDWNTSNKKYTKDKTFIELFEEQVHKSPQDIAIVFEGTALTYQQLHEESNKLANYLIASFDPQPNELIGIMLDRSEKTVISILAILKAGAAYACIDPEYPLERKKFLVEDTALKIVITQSDYLFDLTFYSGNLFAIDIQLSSLDTPLQSPAKPVKPEDLAYVIYTSGTTGRPKGVMVEHHQIVSFACDNNFIDFEKTKVVGGMSNFAFDGSIFDLFFSLANGKKLILIDKQSLLDLSRLDDQFINFQIDTVFITTALFNSLVLNESRCLNHLQQIQFGGERCSIELINKFKNNYKTTSLIHVYGPTENIVFSTYCHLNDYNTQFVAPIGKHLSDKKLYILNPAKVPVPVGIVGELYVGGPGVARGYLNRPDLTSERFVDNPFATDTDKTYGFTRMYKTGDLVRWLSDGNIEYIGRNDEQVKIRGHRIELSEIENVLMQIEGIKLACVVAKERKTEAINSKYVVAYYIPEHVNGITQETIQSELANMLPEYMIPSVLVEMESFPLNPNGKLDKRALPDPEFGSAKNYVAPTSPLETQVCTIWQEVLGVDKIGITDNFFNIGGDSIISIRLVSKMQQSGFNVSVREIFNRKTIQDLLKHMPASDLKKEKDYTPFSLISAELQDKILTENKLPLEQLQDLYPASYLQSGMLVETFAKGNTDAYHIVDSFDINAPFDQAHFKKTWQTLINKHELLRTSFVLSEIGYMNVVYKTVPIDSKLVIKNQFKDHELIVEYERSIGLDMASAGLFRLVVLKDDTNERFSLIFTQHHAIIDGWSLALIIAEFTDTYLYHKDYSTQVLPAYGKFIEQELEALENSSYKKFWMEHLEGYELKLNNLKLNKTDNPLNEQLSVEQDLSPELNDQIIKLTKKLNLPPDVIFLGVYNLVLSMLYNTNDLVIGRTVNNRLEEEGGDNVFGVHLNTLPIRFRTEGIHHKSAKEYLSEIFNDKLTVNDYKLYPYAKIKGDLNYQENIYQCSFNYVHFHIAEKHFNNESIIQQHGESSTSIPLLLNVIRTGVSFKLVIESSTHFIDPETARRLLGSMILSLEQITDNPDKLIKDHKLITEQEDDQLIYQWNATDRGYAKHKLLHELFEEQVAKTPDHLAVVFNGQHLSYKQLNEKSNQLARQLRDHYKKKTNKELSPDTLIALFLDRSLEMVIGILSVLKAGAAYVPMDAGYPKDRIAYMLEDTQAELILSQRLLAEANSDKIPLSKVMHIDLSEPLYTTQDASNLIHNNKSSDLAYIIYTSGTTGRPKGVMVEHQAVSNTVYALYNVYDSREIKKVTAYTSYVFDVSVSELFTTLLQGLELHILDNDIRTDSEALATYFERNEINLVYVPPVLLSQLPTRIHSALKTVIYAGEPCDKQTARTWSAKVKLFNYYGPTEACIYATGKQIMTDEVEQIGFPLQNNKVYILDQKINPVPIGVVGELYIGGAGVARGYLNRQELTEERFIKNPFATEADKVNGYIRMYKTGDLVRWLTDGSIEYIGRNDDQVKIRGYRIELGEIENALVQVKGIKQAAVVTKERKTETGNKKYIVGYYVTDDVDININLNTVQDKLSKMLPEYMLPSNLIQMDSFPLTVNGKLNKRALPDVNFHSLESDYTPATTKMEKEVCKIWQNLLGLDLVGITSDFFAIGGDSISAIQVSHRMSKLLEGTVKVADVFRFKNIEKILANLEKKFELVQPFQMNYNDVLPDLIFIHPGAGGSELYQGLSEMLSTQYNCIGIDNYNLHQKEKISSLNKIANYYLSAFEEKYAFKNTIHLLGWSLGGTIALEMAGILEARGFENINVILLDTFIQDEVMIRFHDEKFVRESRIAYEKQLIATNFDTVYREKVLAVIDIELKLIRTEISRHLKHTKVVLFKANQVNWFNDADDSIVKNNYVMNLRANNINLKVDRINVINLDCTHENILEKGKESISDHLLSERFRGGDKKMKLQEQDLELEA